MKNEPSLHRYYRSISPNFHPGKNALHWSNSSAHTVHSLTGLQSIPEMSVL